MARDGWTQEDRRWGRKREVHRFIGRLSGLRPGIRPFALQGGPDGRLQRVTLYQLRLEQWERDNGKGGCDVVDGEPDPLPVEDSGEEPDVALPPLYPLISGLRGGADEDGNSDSGPAEPHRPGGPRIIEDRVLSGAERVEVQRIIRATAEESDMEVDVESFPVVVSSADSEPDVVEREPVAGPSKPRKRARGRPRKDGSGPFRPDSPTNEELVDKAIQGDVPDLRVVDIVPIMDKPEARRAGGRLPRRLMVPRDPDGGDSDEEDIGVKRWRMQALETLEACDTRKAALLALEALDRVDGARTKSKNIKGDVVHDLRVSSAVARHAILAVCQRSSRFGMEVASKDAIDRLRSECLSLRERTEELKKELNKQTNSRLYLLADKMGRSREPTPAVSPAASPERPRSKGKKRSLQERRGVPDPNPEIPVGPGPPTDSVPEDVEPRGPPIPEIEMGSPVREEVEPAYGRSLSPMTRFAAADPQIMGVLRDIVGSLKGLERRMAALERRPRPPPAPNERRGEMRPASAPTVPLSRSQRRKRRKREGRDQPVGPATPAPVPALRPAAGARARLFSPAATLARTASGSVRTPTVCRGAPPRRGQAPRGGGCPFGHPRGGVR